ncbi:MAG: 6-hydroxymethylpterin diphosphokinase MptE-like protein [Candidatus Kariarchaeaceae archaeon]
MNKFPLDLPVTEASWVNEFMPHIREYLGLHDDDSALVEKYHRMGVNPGKIDYGEILQSPKSVCLGTGPSLEQFEVHELEDHLDTVNLIAADGSFRYLDHSGITPDLIVTDIDGLTIENIEQAITKEIPIQILCHGHNTEAFLKLLPRFRDATNVELVTQGQPIHGWHTSMGFTDGDRSVSLASRFSKSILLVGYDLRSEFIGKYSKPHFIEHQVMTSRKRGKLDIAWQVITWLSQVAELYTLDSDQSPGRQISFADFLKD